MDKRVLILFLILIFIPLIGANADHQSLHVVISNWAPYKGEELLNGGIATDITREALLRVGYAVEIQNAPWQRALSGAIDGNYDVIPAIWLTPEREEGLFFSDPILDSRIVVISMKSYGLDYRNLEDLRGEKVGVGRGWGYPEEFLEADFFTREPAVDLETNLKKLLAGRFNIIVDEELAVRYLVSSKYSEHIESLRYSTVSLEDKPLLVAFSRKLHDYEMIVDSFNEALKEMYEDGTYDEILKKHGVFQTNAE